MPTYHSLLALEFMNNGTTEAYHEVGIDGLRLLRDNSAGEGQQPGESCYCVDHVWMMLFLRSCLSKSTWIRSSMAVAFKLFLEGKDVDLYQDQIIGCDMDGNVAPSSQGRDPMRGPISDPMRGAISRGAEQVRSKMVWTLIIFGAGSADTAEHQSPSIDASRLVVSRMTCLCCHSSLQGSRL